MKDLLHQDDVRDLVRDAYRGIDTPAGAGTVLYGDGELADLPDGAQEWSMGVGNPVRWAGLRPGEDVVDVGCGGGIDTMLAARAVGPHGTVTGVDLLPEMVDRARHHAAQASLANCRFVEGQMEALPLANDSADVLVSNGVVNLSPRKARALLEFHRVVRSGGRISLADIVVDTDLPTEIMTHPSAWAG